MTVIKIMRHGFIHLSTCPVCNCSFTFEMEDTDHGMNDYGKYVYCPDCREKIEVKYYD